MMLRVRAGLVAGLFVGACAPAAPPPAPPVVVTAAAPSPPPIDPTLVSIAALRAPAKLVLDGDLAEWGSLLPPASAADDAAGPPPEPKAPGGRNEEPEKPLPPAPNPREAASHLALALTGEALIVAADLGEAARDGVWLGVGVAPPDVPPIGMYSRARYMHPLNCEVEQIREAEGQWRNGAPNPPEIVAACKAVLARHASMVAAHKQRFTRLYRIDRGGVRAVRDDGTLALIEGAKIAWRPGETRSSVEVSLPLASLPRMVEAPVSWLRIAARAATSTEPPRWGREPWVWARLPEPVAFEPYGELRARAFEAARGRAWFPPGLSYQPSDPLHVEVVQHAGGEWTALAARSEALYEKYAALGDVEVGYVQAFARSLAIFKAGKLLDVVALDPHASHVDVEVQATPKGAITRKGKLLLHSFVPAHMSDHIGAVAPSWTVIEIDAAGGHREVPFDEVEGVTIWHSASPYASKDFTKLGIRGEGYVMDHEPDRGPRGIDVSWRWDDKRDRYVLQRRALTAPKKAKR